MMVKVGTKVDYLKARYEVVEASDLEVSLKKENSNAVLIVKVGTPRFNKIFPELDTLEEYDDRNSVRVDWDRPKLLAEEDDIEDISEDEIEDGVIFRLITDISSTKSKKVKKETLIKYFKEASEYDTEQIKFVLWVYLHRKELFCMDYWELLDTSRKNTIHYKKKYTPELKEFLEKQLGRDKDFTKDEYIELLELIPSSQKYVYMITVPGFQWDKLDIPNKDIKDILENLDYYLDEEEEDDELEEL